METIHSLKAISEKVDALKSSSLKIGFVPTMGNLHQGHLKLVDAAKPHCDIVIASIFVNPMQFGANEDLDKYPRTLEADQEKLDAISTEILFAPTAREMYPLGLENHLKINMPHMASVLCGKSRPTHFEGVCTVVTKLFNLVRPDVAVFGKKDLQQLMIIKQMTKDLCLPISIMGVDTEREKNGLAMSSRNSLLSDKERQDAAIINALLTEMKQAICNGEMDYLTLVKNGIRRLEQGTLKTDYLEIRDLEDFALAKNGLRYDNLGIFAAAYAEHTRLIDNITTNEIDQASLI